MHNRHHQSHHSHDFRDAQFGERSRSFRRDGRHRESHRPESSRDNRPIAPGDGPLYCSKSEGACALLMEKYVPGFKVREGESFQVVVGKNRFGHELTMDFLLQQGVFFEFHAVKFWKKGRHYGDFKDYHEYRDYKRTLASLPNHLKKGYEEQTKLKLGENYYERRRAMLDENPVYRHIELVVALSPGEFYDKIIRRFGQDYPDKSQFCQEFQRTMKDVVTEHDHKQSSRKKRKN